MWWRGGNPWPLQPPCVRECGMCRMGGSKSFPGCSSDLCTLLQPLQALQVWEKCSCQFLLLLPGQLPWACRHDANLRGLPAGFLFSAFLPHGTYLLRREMAAESAKPRLFSTWDVINIRKNNEARMEGEGVLQVCKQNLTELGEQLAQLSAGELLSIRNMGLGRWIIW